jgi:hypothetical protein
MAYTKKPGRAPTFDLLAFTRKLVNGQPITQAQADAFIRWKQWVESKGGYAGTEKGGLRDILNALAIAVDALKENVDLHGSRLNIQAADIAELKAWVAAQPRPFP